MSPAIARCGNVRFAFVRRSMENAIQPLSTHGPIIIAKTNISMFVRPKIEPMNMTLMMPM